MCPDPVEGLLTTIAWTIPGGIGRRRPTHYAFEGAIFVTGAAVQWLRDGLGIIVEAAEIGPLAASIPDTDGVVLRPRLHRVWAARGGIRTPAARCVGITRGTGRAHLARAVVEAMAFQTRDVVEAMAAGLRSHGAARCVPTAVRRPWSCCCSSRPTSCRCRSPAPSVKETTALGAAYLAGLAEGVWDSTDDITANWALDVEVTPSVDRPSRPTRRTREWTARRRARPRLGARRLATSGSTESERVSRYRSGRDAADAPRRPSTHETECRRSAPTPPLGAALVPRNS